MCYTKYSALKKYLFLLRLLFVLLILVHSCVLVCELHSVRGFDPEVLTPAKTSQVQVLKLTSFHDEFFLVKSD